MGYIVFIVLSNIKYLVSDWIQWADRFGWALYRYIAINEYLIDLGSGSAEEEKVIIIQYWYISAVCYWILSEWSYRSSRILSEYLFSRSNGQHNRLSNIEWVILLDKPDTYWIIIWHIYWSAGQCIQYYVGDTVGSAGYPLNIHWVYPLVRLTVHPILSGWYCQISRIPTEYSLGVFIG